MSMSAATLPQMLAYEAECSAAFMAARQSLTTMLQTQSEVVRASTAVLWSLGSTQP